jgi:hypothetical protein
MIPVAQAQPRSRVAVAVNDSDHADTPGVDLEIDAVWIAAEQNSPKAAPHDSMMLGAGFDRMAALTASRKRSATVGDCVRHQSKAARISAFGNSSNAELPHLPEFL